MLGIEVMQERVRHSKESANVCGPLQESAMAGTHRERRDDPNAAVVVFSSLCELTSATPPWNHQPADFWPQVSMLYIQDLTTDTSQDLVFHTWRTNFKEGIYTETRGQSDDGVDVWVSVSLLRKSDGKMLRLGQCVASDGDNSLLNCYQLFRENDWYRNRPLHLPGVPWCAHLTVEDVHGHARWRPSTLNNRLIVEGVQGSPVDPQHQRLTGVELVIVHDVSHTAENCLPERYHDKNWPCATSDETSRRATTVEEMLAIVEGPSYRWA
jgi:hypothetical protein